VEETGLMRPWIQSVFGAAVSSASCVPKLAHDVHPTRSRRMSSLPLAARSTEVR